MDEVDKMRSSQLANTASPEIQERFKRAKKLLLKLNAMSGYEEECRSVLEELIPGIPASATICPPFVAIMVMVSALGNMSLSTPIVLFWTVVISLLGHIR